MPVLMLLLIVPLLAFGQPDTLWTRTFDSGGDDFAVDVHETAGGFVVAATSALEASVDFALIRTDAGGAPIWTRTYGTERNDWCAAIAPAAGGGWLLSGFTFPPDVFSVDAYFVRVDEAGDTLWTRQLALGPLGSESANAILPLADGSFLVAGDADLDGGGLTDMLLIRLGADGDTVWTRIYETTENDGASGLCMLADGNYLLAGSVQPQQSSMRNFYFRKVTPAGDPLWTRSYGGEYYDIVYDVVATPDGGAVFTGLTGSFGANGDLYLGKLSADGDSVWARTFGGAGEDHSHFVAGTLDGGFLIGGHSTSFGEPHGDAYLVRTDAEGAPLWTYLFGGEAYENFESARQTADGGYIGLGTGAAVGATDVFAVRLEVEMAAHAPPPVAGAFALHPNYPNPFNARTTLVFDLPAAAPVRLTVFNTLAQIVATPVRTNLGAGRHIVSFDAAALSSGIYICRLQAGSLSTQRKMVLVR